jgi:hypothetical protein
MFYISNLKNRLSLTTFICISVFLPLFLNAQIIITEIMYDLDGTDSGREWIEVLNNADIQVDISEYKFYESNVNHKISPENEDDPTEISAGEYAIIADNPAKFRTDNPNYSGILLDSAFSLSNNGEVLSIIDPEGSIVHSVTYSPEWGAKGTGNTLQLLGETPDADWIPAEKTPGLTNKTEPAEETSADDSDNNDSTNTESNSNTSNKDSQSSHSGTNDLTEYEEKVVLKIGAGRERYGIINKPMQFKALSNNESSSRVKYQWSFGDADSGGGENPKHTYYSSGSYNVVLNGYQGTDQATSRTKVHIREPKINLNFEISGKDVDILLINDSDFEVNFGQFFFILELNDEKFADFQIPEDTILDPKSQITIASEISDFVFSEDPTQTEEIKLLFYYPNGKLASRFKVKNNNQQIDDQTIQKISSFIPEDRRAEFDALIEGLDELR